MKKKLTLPDYLEGFKNKNRTILSRAITLIESSNPSDQILAQELLSHILPLIGKSRRIGISGTPGVGKSSFIEVFGKMLTSQNHSVAILAVDPTSQVSGGSILGDKTRMTDLAVDPLAFIRPSPAGESLGGVAKKTRESIYLCEAFGFEYVLVETVGVGQSETTVAEMVDMFIMLLQPGSGDDLQGIKRGILELVNMVVVTKDDGDSKNLISKAKHDYSQALHILRKEQDPPKVMSCSSVEKTGFHEIQKVIHDFFDLKKSLIKEQRSDQNLKWMWQLIRDYLIDEFNQKVSSEKIKETGILVTTNKMTAPQGAKILLEELRSHLPK
jgi:LAO/AO transport system kinase